MGQTVRELRKSLRLTQNEFAERLGVGQSRIASAENGDLSEALANKIHDIFGVKVDNSKPEITTTSSDIAVQELINEINFLRNQLVKKDEQIDKILQLVKDEVSSQPPKGIQYELFGAGNQTQQRAA